MKISHSRPPVWDEAKKVFEFDEKTTVFAYGDTLYVPGGLEVPGHLLIHEMVHSEQQEHNDQVAAIWWKRYLVDSKFRIDQEVEAYGAQYKFICEQVKDKNSRFRNLHQLAKDLSSSMYGSAIAYTDAMNRIKLASNMHKK